MYSNHDLQYLTTILFSGNHWFSNLLYFLRLADPLENTTSYQPGIVDLIPREVVQTFPSPRVIVTHRRPQHLPVDVANRRGKLILLYRNPKDTAVSHFHHLKAWYTQGNATLSWNCFIDSWLNGMGMCNQQQINVYVRFLFYPLSFP